MMTFELDDRQLMSDWDVLVRIGSTIEDGMNRPAFPPEDRPRRA